LDSVAITTACGNQQNWNWWNDKQWKPDQKVCKCTMEM
jgi:hypothetical protein